MPHNQVNITQIVSRALDKMIESNSRVSERCHLSRLGHSRSYLYIADNNASRNCVKITKSKFCAPQSTKEKAPSNSLCKAILFILFIYLQILSTQAKNSTEYVSNKSSSNQRQQQQQFRLDCQAGEQRYFNYESSTKIWGSANQQVRIRASLRIRCLEPPTETVLKYLTEVLSVNPSFGLSSESQPAAVRSSRVNTAPKWLHSGRQVGDKLVSGSQAVYAEPILEEVGEAIGEAATRVRRSVSGWLTKTWSSVKDFFVNIFNSSERSTVSHDQALSESGIDIANQCKASKGKPASNSLPIDDSMFDDFEPKYYIGASLNPLGTTAYEFMGSGGDNHGSRAQPSVGAGRNAPGYDEDDDENNLSFFDDPKPKQVPLNRAKRAVVMGTRANNRQSKTIMVDDYERLLRLPFVFVQSRTGRIIEIRFSNDDVDTSIKNFKRHLCDLFATNLDINKTQTNEVSPIGKHTTKYLIDSSSNSSIIRQSLMKQSATGNNKDEQQSAEQLVRVLAMVGMNSVAPSIANDPNSIVPLVGSSGKGVTVESRDPNWQPNGGGGGSQGDSSLSVLRSINSTSNIQLVSRTVMPDIDQIQVRVKQVQHISEGRMTCSAGQLGMSLIQGSNNGGQARSARMRRAAYRSEQQQQLEDIAELLQVSTSFSVQLVPSGRLGNFADITPGEGGSSGEGDGDDSDDDANERLPARVRRSAPVVGESDSESVSEEIRGKSKSEENSKKADNVFSAAATATNQDNLQLVAGLASKMLVKRGATAAEQTTKNQPERQVKFNDNSSGSGADVSGSDSGTSRTATNKQQLLQSEATAAKQQQRQQQGKAMKPREPLFTRPSDSQELQRVISEWKQLELKLQFSPSNLLSESSNGIAEGQAQRLEILRDQIQMRLNEEFLRNKFGRAEVGGFSRKAGESSASTDGATTTTSQTVPSSISQMKRNDLGLGLTQIILDSGITGKRKGSVYSTLEEIIDLELSLEEDSQEGTVSRLLKDTIRVDKLRAHCKSAIASIEEIRAQSAPIVLKSPFNVAVVNNNDDLVGVKANKKDEPTMTIDEAPLSEGGSSELAKLSRIIGKLQANNGRRLERCKQVVQLMLRVSERQVADLVLELIDECNKRMLAGAKDEELGYGPTSRYYRNLRQQFTELLSSISRPSEPMLDKLVSRLRYTRLAPLLAEPGEQLLASGNNKAHRSNSSPPQGTNVQQEFTYVKKVSDSSGTTTTRVPNSDYYNKSLLREEDDFNNNDADGSLLMTITSLAAKPSIGHAKRVEVAEKLLTALKGSSCSLFHGPDLDVLESMGNFQEPLDEIVGKVVHLARRCKHLDQYLVACVHALQGQLHHNTTRRFLSEHLRSSNASCTVKSEIVLTLLGAMLIDDLKPLTALATTSSASWPSVGLNQVDSVLLELVDEKNKCRALDRKCLQHLVAHYMSKKRGSASDKQALLSGKDGNQDNMRRVTSSEGRQRRQRRAISNENSFWDEAQCKRWALPDQSTNVDDNNITSLLSTFNLAADLGGPGDNIDDNSILVALANNKSHGGSRSRSAPATRRAINQRLLEKEATDDGLRSMTATATTGGQTVGNGDDGLIRRRHKCSASKKFGPKNAEAILKAEVVNDLVGTKNENKFLARFRLATNFLGNRIDVGRMYLWHQKRMTRAHVNILGKSLWDTTHSCHDKAPHHLLYMPLFDFNLWLVKVSVGIRLQSEMGFFSNCDSRERRHLQLDNNLTNRLAAEATASSSNDDELELYPTIKVRASGEASAKFVVARAGMSLASNYGYQGNIRVSRQPESCMSIYSAHQPMNITFSSWFQLWDSDCHYWGSRNKAEPQATKWKLQARNATTWLEDECLAGTAGSGSVGSRSGNNSSSLATLTTGSPQSIRP